MKKLSSSFFLLIMLALVACQNIKPPKQFVFAVLPTEPEWDVSLNKPLEVVRQKIQFSDMPAPVWENFPLPDFSKSGLQPLITSGTGSYGYGMDSELCVPKALFKANGISPGEGWGVAGGQYAYYELVTIEDPLLYDPRQYAFLIAYDSAHLEITFPDLETMHVRRLIPPD